jgi:hypothetical protein
MRQGRHGRCSMMHDGVILDVRSKIEACHMFDGLWSDGILASDPLNKRCGMCG